MLLNDFIHIFSDAIQTHEGWLSSGAQSWPNLNPGNLHMEGQPGASGAIGSEAKFDSFYDGKQALNNDIAAKIKSGKNTIRDIVATYAPANFGNDVEAYIASIVNFFKSRNIVITADQYIISLPGTEQSGIENIQTPIILIAVNQLYKPVDWAAVQLMISQCATYMPEYAFSTRYSNTDLSGSITVVQDQIPPGGQYSGPSGDSIKNILRPYNAGQVMNMVIYDGTIMQGHPEPYGGCEWQGGTLAPMSAVCAVMYQGTAFVDSGARAMWHELIHELFKLTEQSDTLHAYLLAHGGYQNDLAVDLEAVFTGNSLNTPQAIVNLQRSEESIA